MSSRFERITISWVADFLGRGQKVIALTPEDQQDPRLLALLAWWDERSKAEADAQRAQNSGDPFTMT